MKKSVLILLLLIPSLLFGQHLFKEKFNGCVTDQFALESDSADAKMDPARLISVIFSSLDEKTVTKTAGILKLQILVDTDGKSCLLSVENETNTSSAKLKLKKNIDANLVWGKPVQKVSAIIFLQLKDGKVGYKRMGLNGNIGWHEITD